MKQKITTLLLCFAMVLSLCTFLSFGTFAAETEVPEGTDVWNGTTAAPSPLFAGGDGQSAETAWQINTAAQLAYLGTLMSTDATYADDFYVLTANLDMAGLTFKKAIGTTNSFKGTFDGGNFTIYNLAGEMFNTIGGANVTTTIQNLKTVNATGVLTSKASNPVVIKNCDFDVNTTKPAYLVSNKTSAKLTVEGVTIRGSVTNTAGAAAAFVLQGTNQPITFINCTNYATVTAKGKAAGFLTETANPITYQNCFNYGDITSTEDSAAGLLVYRSNATAMKFEGCANYGDIKGAVNAGGITCTTSNNNIAFTIINCANYGAIHATTGMAGGIASKTYGTSSGGFSPAVLQNIVSIGAVTADSEKAASFVWELNGRPGKAHVIKNVFYTGASLYGTSNIDASKFSNCVAYAAGESGSYASLDSAVWSYASLPGSATKAPQLANAPHLINQPDVPVNPDAPQYTVTFVDENGSVLDTQTVYEGAAALAPEVALAEGYELIGWANVETNETVDITSILADVTVKPITQLKQFKVQFLDKNGSLLSEQTVAYGQAASAPAAELIPSLESYEFVGWSVDFSYVTEDLTVVAKYAYTGTYFGGGRGTEEDPFQIKNEEQLRDIATKIANDTEGIFAAGHYKLMADIDLAGANWTPISTFCGTFDGNGHVISNLYVPNSNKSLGFIARITGDVVFSNLTFKNAKIATNGAANASRGVIVGTLEGNITFNNCHVINGQARGNSATIGLFVGSSTISGAHLNVYNCTVSGSMTGSGHTNMGGFFGGASGSGYSCISVFENCISYITLDTDAKNAGGFIGGNTQGGSDTKFINCIFAGSLKTSQGNTGGFMGTAHNYQPVTFINSASYGTIRANAAAGGFIGDKGANVTLKITNCAVSGTIYSVEGFAGGVAAAFSGSGSVNINGLLVTATIEAPAEDKAAGAVVGKFLKKSDTYANIFTTMEVVVGAYGADSDMAAAPTATLLTSLTAVPEGLSSDVWAIGALPVISGASVSFGGSVALNVYAEYGIVLKAHAADTLFVDGKAVAYANKVVFDGKTYAQFTFDGIKMADIETKYALSVISGIKQMEYSVFTYVTNTYAEADVALQNVLVALLCYGNAAQETPTAIANAVALIPELEAIVADYVEANYANVTLTPVQSEGLKVGFNLYGFVQPVFKVADSITKVTVTVGGVTSELVTIDGYAFYYDLCLLAINEEMTVTFYEGENVVLTTNYAVANYITEGIAGDTLTDAEKTLCKALAVFVDAVAAYVNN